MKITIENPTYSQIISVERTDLDDATISQMMDEIIIPILISAGYTEKVIEEYFSEE